MCTTHIHTITTLVFFLFTTTTRGGVGVLGRGECLILQIIRPIQRVERYERDRKQQSGVFVDFPRQHRVGIDGR